MAVERHRHDENEVKGWRKNVRTALAFIAFFTAAFVIYTGPSQIVIWVRQLVTGTPIR